MNAWISALIYLFYRVVRFLFHSAQSCLLWRFTGVSDHLARIRSGWALEDCQVLTILYRKRLAPGDISGSTDFVWSHDRFVKAKDVLGPNRNWTLYTLDKEYAYFLLTPEPWPYYHARNAPFAFPRQFQDAIELARMPFRAFCRFAEESLADPLGPVVYYSNAARSGTTLLTRVMQVSEDRIRCFSEPDAFTSLAVFHQRGFISDDLATRLVKAIIKYYCKTQEPGQTYLMKAESNGTYLVPMIKKAMPRVKHMFTFRRDTRRVVSSLEKTLRATAAGEVWALLWRIWPPLAVEFANLAAYEYVLFKRFSIGDVLDESIIIHLASWYYYYKNRDLFDIPIIYYEDLIIEKEKTLKMVFQLCELPFEEFKQKALKEFENDSQGGTHLDQGAMKKVKEAPLTEEKIKKIYDICDQLNIPRVEV